MNYKNNIYTLKLKKFLSKLKIAIGYKLNDGPWGGGNQFAISLKELVEEGHEVFFNLSRNDLDIILLTDPRKEALACHLAREILLNILFLRIQKLLLFTVLMNAMKRKNLSYGHIAEIS